MTTLDVITIIASFLGSLIAVLVTRHFDNKRARRVFGDPATYTST